MILKIFDRIRNRQVEFFNNFQLNLQYDSVGSTFSFDWFYDEANSEHRQLACVSHFHECTIEHNGELLLTGYILSNNFRSGVKKQLVSFGGYSLPGVLEDCKIPPNISLQSDGKTLKQIAETLLAPFKLKLIVDPSVSDKVNSRYDTSTASERQSVKSYLCELANQKNVIVTHNEHGNLLFTSAKTGLTPLFEVGKGMIGTGYEMNFNGQAMHSDITVLKQAGIDGGNAGEFTIKNPYCPIVYRPDVIVQNSGNDNDTQDAAKHALANELKNIKLTITTDRWEVDKKIIKPNNLISLVAPELYIFTKTNFFIEKIAFVGDTTKTTAILNCVIPEVYNFQTPKNIFVSDHFKQNA